MDDEIKSKDKIDFDYLIKLANDLKNKNLIKKTNKYNEKLKIMETKKNKLKEKLLHSETLGVMSKYQIVFIKLFNNIKNFIIIVENKSYKYSQFFFRKLLYINMNHKKRQNMIVNYINLKNSSASINLLNLTNKIFIKEKSFSFIILKNRIMHNIINKNIIESLKNYNYNLRKEEAINTDLIQKLKKKITLKQELESYLRQLKLDNSIISNKIENTENYIMNNIKDLNSIFINKINNKTN